MDRITEVTRDCFDALVQLRRLDGAALPAMPVLQQRLRRFVDAMFTRAAQVGFGREEANDIAYAVVALTDEVVLSRSEALREAWPDRSLQLHYFHENVAGEAFFTRLENLRRDPRRREILRVYYLALVLGFQGRYQVRGGELELMRLTEDIERDLVQERRFDPEVVSPRGERPEGGARQQRARALVPWLAASAVALLVLVYAVLKFSLGVTTDDVVQRIASAIR